VPNILPITDRMRGCLLAGAVGDALGAPVEFLNRAEIISRFGPLGIRDYVSAYGLLGAITDDTQMTLFTADGLLRSLIAGGGSKPASPVENLCHAYLRWLLTQGERSKAQSLNEGLGWLDSINELHSSRAPGRTCIAALQAKTHVSKASAKNDSKGCGGVMRVAPVGLFYASRPVQTDDAEVFQLGVDAAALTHGHPAGCLTAGVLAVLVYRLVLGTPLTAALADVKVLLTHYRDHSETLAAIELAETLASRPQAHDKDIKQLGQGWVAEEALAIGIYVTLVAESLEHGIVLSVNHDGDSDSTGSVAGNLLGAVYGEQAIPQRWLVPLELRETIMEIADDLAQCWRWPLDNDTTLSKELGLKYPPI
jgi:ADP-ribosyl-[dinitrogen reductase] hydrolase